MTTEIPIEFQSRYIGLLTDRQKQAGYFCIQDDDFIYIFHRNNGHPKPIGIFPYETATVKQIRDYTQDNLSTLDISTQGA